MFDARRVLATILIAGLIAGGCQDDSRATIIVEYHPNLPPVTKKAPDSEVFVLWRWYPVLLTTTAPARQPKNPQRHYPVEVAQVYVARGSQIGFCRQNNQLVGIAGATTKPLEVASYTWRTLPGSNTRAENQNRRATDVISVVGEVILAAALLPVAVFVALQTDDGDEEFPDSNNDRPRSGRTANQRSSTPAGHFRPTSRPAN